MPQRFVGLLMALTGLLLVVGIVLVGLSPHRARRTGPRWKRRLVEAGLLVLAALGFPAFGQEPPAAKAPAAAAAEAPAGDLAEAREWQTVVGIWREAEEIASGRRGLYPFDEAGQKKILTRLEGAVRNVQYLHEAGLLSAAEAGLLQKDLALLREGVQAKRPTEMRMATCYRPMRVIPAKASLGRLSERLPLLERLAEAEALRPQVLARVLTSVARDLETVGDERLLRELTEQERDRAQELREDAAASVESIRARLRGGVGELEDAPEWQAVLAAWEQAAPLALSGQSTTAEREVAKAKLESACEAAESLAAAGLLRQAEAELLCLEAEHLKKEIYRNPPTDCQVTCYDMAFLPPARASMDRLAARAALLEQLAAAGKVNPAAIEKVRAAIEADLKTLSGEQELKVLPEADRAKAMEVRARVLESMEQLRKLLAETR